MDEAKVSKKTRGRQRIEIKKLESKENLNVTFSKRKKGLLTKASELSLFCGAEVAIIIISPHKRLFTYGHPSVEAVLDRFLTEKEGFSGLSFTKNDELDVNVNVIKQQLNELLEQLEKEEKIAEEIKQRNNESSFWWDEYSTDDMGLEELEQYAKSLEQIKINVVDELAARDASKADTIVAQNETKASVFNQLIDPNNYVDQQNIFNDLPPLEFGFNDDYFLDNKNIGGGLFDHK